MQANDLEQEELPAGELLLIPRTQVNAPGARRKAAPPALLSLKDGTSDGIFHGLSP